MESSAHPRRDSNPLLSPTVHDDDVSIHSVERSDQDTDSEDDEAMQGKRTSAEIRSHDRRVILDEDEWDNLLEESRQRGRRGSALAPLKKLFARGQPELDGPSEGDIYDETEKGAGKRQRRRERRAKKKKRLLEDADRGEDGQLMYEMEEGDMKEGSATGSSSEMEESDDRNRQGSRGLRDKKFKRKCDWKKWCFILLLTAIGLAILVLLALRLSLKSKKGTIEQTTMSNGTALFAPTTILISLDGFRADFLNRGLTPRLKAFIEEGVSPPYMNPSFPSVTFPNHYTLATGLHPESHGIVGNTFWDPELKDAFYYTHASAMQPKWWGGEPIWATAENYGIRTAVHMWPGSEAHIEHVDPTFLDKFNGKEPLPNKVARVLELLDKPGEESELEDVSKMRPQFIAAYVPNVDSDGHKYGPNSTEIRKTISDVDNMLDQLFRGLQARNLTKIVNVVVVSDHGMATTDISRLIQLEDIVDPGLIEHMDGWPLYGLRPKNPSRLHEIYDFLKAKSSTNHNFDVYLRDKDMPERYHFSKNERIAPLWIVPKTGWAIVTKTEFDVAEAKKKGWEYHPRGLHGYDNEHPLMRAIFVARGPAFPHEGNSRLEPFQNTEVYNLICDSLNLPPKPNNGTLRLPLHPVGLHTPETNSSDPQDPDPSFSSSSSVSTKSSGASVTAPDPVLNISPVEASSAADPNEVPPTIVGVGDPDASVDRPSVTDDSAKSKSKGFWVWLKGKFDGVKVWFSEVVDKEEKETSTHS